MRSGHPDPWDPLVFQWEGLVHSTLSFWWIGRWREGQRCADIWQVFIAGSYSHVESTLQQKCDKVSPSKKLCNFILEHGCIGYQARRIQCSDTPSWRNRTPTTIASHHVWLFPWQSHLPRAVVAARTYCCGAESCKLSDTHTKSQKLICPGHGAPQSMAYSFTSVGKFFVYVRGGSLIIWKI